MNEVNVLMNVMTAFVDLSEFELKVLVDSLVSGEELIETRNRFLLIITVTHN